MANRGARVPFREDDYWIVPVMTGDGLEKANLVAVRKGANPGYEAGLEELDKAVRRTVPMLRLEYLTELERWENG